MRTRLANEQGFALIELVFSVVLITVGLLALMGVFASGVAAVNQAGAVATGTTIADKVMEVYRDARNCGIYLHGGTGNDTSGLPDGIPNSSSASYSAYHADAAAYASGMYYNNGTPSATPLWVTENTTGVAYAPVLATSSACLPTNIASSSGIDPTKAVQRITGPDNRSYTVFSYIVIIQPSGAGYAKQVTVKVFNPIVSTQVLARESALFDPNAAP